MLNVGLPEITVILMIALLLLGPQKLPEFARWVGKAMRELRQVTHEVRTAIDMELEKEEFGRLQKEFTETLDPSFVQDAIKKDPEGSGDQEKQKAKEEEKTENHPQENKDIGIYHPGENIDEYSFLQTASDPSNDGDEDLVPHITPRGSSDEADEPVEPNLTKRFSSIEETPEDRIDELPIITGPPPGTVSRNAKDWEDDEEVKESDDEQAATPDSQTSSSHPPEETPQSSAIHSSEPTS